MTRLALRIAFRIALCAAIFVIAACEPLDLGGGSGVGGRLAFIRKGALVVSLDSGDAEKSITEENTSAEPALSPNGQTVVFAYSESGSTGRGIAMVAYGDLTITSLAEPSAGASFGSPTFSPDGEHVVFVATSGAGSELWKVAVAGGTPERISAHNDVYFPAFVNDRTLIVASGAGLALSQLDLATDSVTALGGTLQSRACVAPGGERIAYSRGGIVIVRTLATSAEKSLATTSFGDQKPAFSPDGSFVAFEAQGPTEQQPKLYAAPSDGTGTTTLLQVGYDVAWGL